MNTLIRSITVSLLLTLFVGCSTTPTAEQLAVADYGPPVNEAVARDIARKTILARLKDPDSAKFKWVNFKKGYDRKGLFGGGGIVYGYWLEVHVNARNSYGGYVGDRRNLFLFRGRQIVAAWVEVPLTGGGTYMQRRM